MRNFALIALWIAGCAVEPITEGRHAIVEGSIEAGYPEVVAVYRSAGALSGLCSGTVIGPYAVLTAKHCAWEETDDGWRRASPASFLVLVGTDVSDGATITEYAEVLDIRAPPGDDVDMDINYGNDIAILLMDRTLTVTPRGWAAGGPDEGDRITIVGFGRNNPFTDDSGVKYSGTTSVSEAGMRIFETYGDSSTCQGDSGGPAIDPGGEVVGVTSFGPGDCSIAASYFTRVPRHAALIEDALAWVPPCEPSDEVCDGTDNNCDGRVDEICNATGEGCTDASECTGGRCEVIGGTRICTEECFPYLNVSLCPAGYRCQPTDCGAGLCAPDRGGAGEAGAPCTSHDDCALGQCHDVGGTMRCGRECFADDVACDEGLVCEIFVEGDCGTCIPPELSTAPRAFGQDCEDDAICRSGDCADEGFCTQTCSTHGDCGARYHCRAGRCARGELGRVGAECVSSDDCHDSAPDCVELDGSGVCASECTAEGCALGYVCGQTEAGMRCIPQGIPLGDACTANEDCRSRICAGVCTLICDERACPEGYECRPAGEHSGCFVPEEGGGDGGCAVGKPRDSGLWTILGGALAIAVLTMRRRARR